MYEKKIIFLWKYWKNSTIKLMFMRTFHRLTNPRQKYLGLLWTFKSSYNSCRSWKYPFDNTCVTWWDSKMKSLTISPGIIGFGQKCGSRSVILRDIYIKLDRRSISATKYFAKSLIAGRVLSNEISHCTIDVLIRTNVT